MQSRFSKQTAFASIFLAFVLLFSQTVSLLHAEIHAFHDHHEECDIYLGVEYQGVDLPKPFCLPQISFQRIHDIESTFAFTSTQALTPKARAPPVFS